jgi:DNA modification methylase
MSDYTEFLESKRIVSSPSGFVVDRESINPKLFPFQRDITHWALKRGKAGVFADCGLGKTAIQLEWAKHVSGFTGKPVLIYAPLAVSQQTKREGEEKFEVPVTICANQSVVQMGVDATNYEKMAHFPDSLQFGGVVLDESSILKGFDGKIRKALTEWASHVPFRLCCTATPAPNDYMELGNHAEFLGVMTCTEMLSMFFVHDGGDTSKWRIKKHATEVFWKWVASWAVALRKPSDLGYSDEGFILPPLEIHPIVVSTDVKPESFLFPVEGRTLQERNQVRRESIADRAAACATIVNAAASEPWLIWCNLNSESDALSAAISGAVEVVGSDAPEFKESAMLDFVSGKVPALITKPTIAGYGLNFQHCAHVAFVGLSDSYEQFYQAVRRCWRFGQTRAVQCYIITAETEGAVVRNIQRKEQQATEMMDGMVRHMRDEMQKNVRQAEREVRDYETATERGDNWTAHLGDCVDWTRQLEPESVGYTIFSPPFASLYTYSDSERDMGNSKDYSDFARHFAFLVDELMRVTIPGRLLSFHCMNLPFSKERDGFIGIRDFRGDLIRMFIEADWIFHSEVVIWKDPVTAMQRTKALGLLYKQLRKDSAMSRQGIPDYLVTMRKPGVNPQPVKKTHESFPVELWQRYASPVWMDINPSDTLTKEAARDDEDERHICPLQLEVIERAVRLWTNPDDLVLSPFMGIGSEGHEALKQGRRFIGIELKRSYWEQAVSNLRYVEDQTNAQGVLFVHDEASA